MRRISFRTSVIVIFCLITGAGQSFCQSTSAVAPFAGNWKFTFSGALNGDGTMKVIQDGTILIYLSLGKYQHFFTNPVSLHISESGSLQGDILFSLLDVGKIVGLFSPDGDLYGRVSTPLFNVGVVTGMLTKDAGSGEYQSVAGNGNWTAQKN